MSVSYRVELEGFPTEVFAEGQTFTTTEPDADGNPVPVQRAVTSAEKAWDAYKVKHGERVRRRNHHKTPVLTRIEE